MRWVKKNTKKIVVSLFIFALVFQGTFTLVDVALAQGIDRIYPTSEKVIDEQIRANANAAASDKSTVTGGQIPDAGCGITNISGCIKQAFIWILLQLRNFIYIVLASPAAAAFAWSVDPANVSGPRGVLNMPAIYQLWQFIRDFFNLFFILILLFSAFATIFQVDSFNIRNIFKNVLLVALLINFSFPITRFLIDAANVPMYYFINDVIGNGTGKGGMIAMNNMLSSSGISVGTMTTTGDNNDIVPVLMSIVFAFLFSISLGVLSVLMIIRLVALTLLLIFSPIGFAGALLPGFSKYGQEWWSKFWSYALFGPAAALMLVVSLKFLESSGSLLRSMEMVGTDITPTTGGATLVSQAIFFTIPLMLIWFTIGLANKFSIAGAAAVVGVGYGAAHWTRKKIQGAAIGTAKWGGRKVEKRMAENKYMRYLSPTVLKTAWKGRAEEQKHKDEASIKQSAAKVQDQLNSAVSRVVTVNPKRWFKPGADHTDHEFAEAQRQSAEERKAISDVSTNGDYVINELKVALENQDTAKVDAALQTLAKNNDMNDMLTVIGDDKKYGLARDAEDKVIVSSANMLKLLPQILQESGEKNADLLTRRMMVIGEQATGAGNFAFGGMTKFNPELNHGRGGFEVQTEEGQAKWAAGKVKNLESQKRQTTIHPDSLFTRNSDGKFGDINGRVAEEIIGTFTQGDVTESRRSRDDMKSAIYNAHTNIDEKVKDKNGNEVYRYAGFRKMYETNSIFKDYVDAVKKMKEATPPKEKTPEVKRAEAAAQPTDTVSPGGIVIPSASKPRGDNR